MLGMSKRMCTAAFLTLWVHVAALAQPPAASPTAPPATEPQEPVVGQLEHAGYGLAGSGGRHYIFGGLAVADYVRDGRRHIVTLQLEEPTTLPKPDEDFLYYRELGSGQRWAIARHPLADDTYAVYFQPAAAAGEQARPWALFHRARLIWPERGAEGGSPPQVPQIPPKKEVCIDAP